MKKIILIIVLIAMNAQAEIRLATAQEGWFSTNGVIYSSLIGKDKVETYEEFITRTTLCKKFKVLAMSQNISNGKYQILIDC